MYGRNDYRGDEVSFEVIHKSSKRGSERRFMDESERRTTFVVDEVTNIVKESIENNIGSSSYVHTKVPQWTSTIVEQILNQLTKLGKPFKYIVTCVIMQKCGAGLHTASSCYWDNSTDGSCTVKWENKSMYFIVTVFGLAI
ncbi:Dynein light chain Tctex-type [Echinococcus granulosus]|uniref:Dynein light chain Tctex-type n=1 Tax=Echinococcus granulosus TaxID=6210 RepID=W6UFM3_ECHGR|nr:Dynein light chain Tctex-type [Echinococcus granulosus]EUB59691.1 Dynein light chain Tctex-type [Echinococcus granulosus]